MLSCVCEWPLIARASHTPISPVNKIKLQRLSFERRCKSTAICSESFGKISESDVVYYFCADSAFLNPLSFTSHPKILVSLRHSSLRLWQQAAYIFSMMSGVNRCVQKNDVSVGSISSAVTCSASGCGVLLGERWSIWLPTI